MLQIKIVLFCVFLGFVASQRDNCQVGECVLRNRCLNYEVARPDIRTSVAAIVLYGTCVDNQMVCCPTGKITNNNTTTTCGIRKIDGAGHRIGLGEDTEFGELPWTVLFLKQMHTGTKIRTFYQGGGSLIHPKVVLTAAHILQNITLDNMIIRAGEWDARNKDEVLQYQNRKVAEIIIHPDYYDPQLYNDVALLVLSEPFDVEEHIQTVCLPPQNYQFDNLRCIVSGWGTDKFGDNGTYEGIMKQIELPIVPHNVCETEFQKTRLGIHYVLHKHVLCAGGESEKDACTGDGGSPLVCPIPSTINRYYQSGIVSFGIGCGEKGRPGAYSNVAAYRSWIDEEFQKRNLDTNSYTF